VHPRSDQASAVWAILEERDRFEKARAADTPQKLRRFLLVHPNGQHAQAATARLAELETAAYEKAARGDERATALFLEQFPDSQGAAAIRVQLREREDVRLSAESQAAAAVGDFRAAETHAAAITYPRLREKVEALIADAVDTADWATVEKKREPAAYEHYLRQHAAGRWASVARERLEEIARTERERAEDLAQLQVVARLDGAGNASGLETLAQTAREPVAARAREAAARIREDERAAIEAEEQAWTKASAAGTGAAWRRYLRKHRCSRRGVEALDALSEADSYERTARLNRIGVWKEFLARHPAGPHLGAAGSSLSALEALPARAPKPETVLVPQPAVPRSGALGTP
jgi:hypothetical protein